MAVAGIGGAAPYSPDSNPSRSQTGNPFGQVPFFFHRIALLLQGRRQDLERMRVERPGKVRRWFTVTTQPVPATPPFSWPRDSFDAQTGGLVPGCQPIRYLISDNCQGDEGGNQLSNPGARAVTPFIRSAGNPPLIRAGQQQGRPTVRSRLTSFGSRVPPINQAYPSEQVPGG